MRLRSKGRSRRSFTPNAEELEGRRLLSTYNVTNFNDSGAGSLRAAIALANSDPGSTVQFTSQGTVNLNSQIEVSASTWISSGNSNYHIGINCQGQSHRAFLIDSGINVGITHFDIHDGNADWGGLIYNNGANNLQIYNSNLYNGTANHGGGALGLDGGSTTLHECIVSSNSAIYGGAILNSYGDLYVEDSSSIEYNYAEDSGGALYTFGYTDLEGGYYAANIAHMSGGFAVNCGGGELDINGAEVQANQAREYGGAIMNVGYSGGISAVNQTDSLFQDNTSNYGGGAICSFHAGVWSVRGYFSGNYAANVYGNDILSGTDYDGSLSLTDFSTEDSTPVSYCATAWTPPPIDWEASPVRRGRSAS